MPIQKESPEKPRPLRVNVIYTQVETTTCALRAAEILARDFSSTIHLHATLSVPRRISVAHPLVPVSFLKEQVCKMVEALGSRDRLHVVHIHVCRNRLETLLSVLPPNSLLVIGGYRHFWPTWEVRLSKALSVAGHSVAHIDPRAERTEDLSALWRQSHTTEYSVR